MSSAQPGEVISGESMILTNVPNVGEAVGGDSQQNFGTQFWNNAAVLAGAQSPAVSLSGFGKIRIFVKSGIANTFNVQFSLDGGATWYTLTQDNAGTLFIIATTASNLQVCRDLNTFGGSIRLIAVTADTVTAGYAAESI